MVTLSQKDWKRIRVIEKAVAGRLSVREAALLLGRGQRQVQRLKQRYDPEHLDWVRHGNCGKPTLWALPAALQQAILAQARRKYAGFNDSHLHQELLESRVSA